MLSLPTLSIPSTVRSVEWKTANSPSFALNLIHSLKTNQRPLVIVTEDTLSAEKLTNEIRFFGGQALVFPDLEILPFDPLSPQPELISERLRILSDFQQGKIKILIIAVPVLMQSLCPPHFLNTHVLNLKIGQTFNRDFFISALVKSGYVSVSKVIHAGEFAIRGGIFDLFPSGSQYPIRVDCLDDEIDTIRLFDPDTQRSVKSVEQIELLPAREFEITDESILKFKQKFKDYFSGQAIYSDIYKEISKEHLPAGIENYLPLFFDQATHFFEYFKSVQPTLILFPKVVQSAIAQWQLIEKRYESYRYDQSRPLMAPNHLYLSPEEMNGLILEYPCIQLFLENEYSFFNLDQTASDQLPQVNPSNFIKQFDALSEAQKREQFNRLDLKQIPFERLFDFVAICKELNCPLVIITDSLGRREILFEKIKKQIDQDYLSKKHLLPNLLDSFDQFLKESPSFSLVASQLNSGLEKGFIYQKPNFIVLTELELLGIKPVIHRKRTQKDDINLIIRDLESLKENDPIVHIEHGVGRYCGLELIDQTEFLVINYQNNNKLYVPVTSLDKLSYYSGSNSETTPWHKLGTDAWNRACKKAAQKAHDVASELLDLYARREVSTAHQAPDFDETEYQKFCETFPFEETEDQKTAILAVKEDLLRGKMDRIICGDVGFGKTEVAMRASFICASQGMQVAIIAPTTLLAEQHTKNFMDRFAQYPFKIGSLSRFVSSKEVKQTLNGLQNGTVDIVIGTHKLLSDDIHFKNLGLIIIDEEHRFGVKQKEQFKKLRVDVNMLTMTATPIPRTLNMALSGLRDLSVIATPPEGRLAVKTFAHQWNDTLIFEAIMREFNRGGQVYFLHNDVVTLPAMAEALETLYPNIKIGIAHGQMPEKQLEQVMLDFYHHRIQLLLCSTIIESGIDVPNANTIIIHRADKLGLAQLHQLRGRVGRSSHRAYCYLITPDPKAMTKDAVKRIEAIMETSNLGAGFMLANHDLEIRGTGELLGESQSGQINEIGFSLYMEILTKAVDAIKSGKEIDVESPFKNKVEIDLGVPSLIPEDYLPDINLRLTFYKKISSAQSDSMLNEIQIEMIDRFGLFPEPIHALFKITELKLIALSLNLKKIQASQKEVKIAFGTSPNINIPALMSLIQRSPNLYQLQGNETLKYLMPLETLAHRFEAVKSLLTQLS